MEEELLQEIDSLIKPAIRSAYNANKSALRYGIDIRPAMANYIQRQIDHTKVALSEKFYDLNQLMDPHQNDQELLSQLIRESSNDQQMADFDVTDYVRELPMGYAVYNGMQWVEMSLSAQIELVTEPNANANGTPAVRLHAFDPQTDTTVTYINDDSFNGYYSQPTNIFSENTIGEYPAHEKSVTYKDPFFDLAKKGVGLGGTIAGTLEAHTIGKHYKNLNEPLRNLFHGGDYSKGSGSWKSLDGKWRSFKEIQEAENAFKQGSLRTSANSARMRGANAARGFKVAGKICFGISLYFTVNDVKDAYINNYSNNSEVYAKSTTDVVLGLVAFIPVYGWVISGTYFLLDAGGAFGNWGRPSGYTQEFLDNWSQKNSNLASLKLYEMDYEVDYHESDKEKMLRMQYEAVQQQRDNTYYMPKTLYKKN